MGISLVIANETPSNRVVDEMWLKRQAIQIASQLPEDRAKAIAVLDYAKVLVTDFMTRDFSHDAT
jgi:hypothetical protein